MQHGAERVVDLVGHAGGQPTDREHFVRLYYQFFHVQALGDVVDTDHRATPAGGRKRVEGQGVMPGFVVARPADALDGGGFAAPHGVAQGAGEIFQIGEHQGQRFIQRIGAADAAQLAGGEVPLGDKQLVVHGDQRRGHGVNDAVEVVLKAGQLVLDLAAHLYFELQLALTTAGFFGQFVGLLFGGAGFVAGVAQFLFAGLNAREHSVEGLA